MAYLLSKRTADELTDMIASRGSSKIGPYNAPRDVGSEEDSTVWSFAWSVSGSTCFIGAGILQIGAASYEVEGDTVTLSGAVEYVYIYHKKDHSESGFGHSSSIPNSAGDEWRFILCKLTSTGSTWIEVWTGHKGNVILAAPTA